MVRVELLNEALRGGDSAKTLVTRTKKRLDAANRTLQEALRDAPDYVVESRTRHQELCSSSEALNAELDMLSESLEEITLKSQNVVTESRVHASKSTLLAELASALPPFVQVADALHVTDTIENQSFLELQGTLHMLQAAILVAQASNHPLLLRTADELENRAQETTALMNARYMDLFQIKSNSVSARFLQLDDTGDSSSAERPAVGVASEALEKVGLLQNAINNTVEDIMRNDVARGLRAATIFFSADAPEGRSLEWSFGDGNDGEVLEFSFDDIEGFSEEDIDAMSESLDISNAAARAVKLFDMFRDVVLGEKYAGDLALALQPWFEEHVLPASGVAVSERRSFQGTGVPKEKLRTRAHVTTVSARVVERALQARGSPQFRLSADQDALERTVGNRCSIDAVSAAKRATLTFADADHDPNLFMQSPISVTQYLPRSQRTPEYFPPCLVSQSAATVLAIFDSTRSDAIDAHKGGSLGIAEALDSAAVEILRLYVRDVQMDHADELRSSYRLKSVYYCDCRMLSHACKLSLSKLGETTEANTAGLREVANDLDRTALQWMGMIRQTAERNLTTSLDTACWNGALGAYGTLTRLQRGTALLNAKNSLDVVLKELAEIIPTETAEQGAATLCEMYLTRLCDEVIKLPEISAEGCEQIDKILSDSLANVHQMMGYVAKMNEVRRGAPPPPQATRLETAKKRVDIYREVLSSRMEDLVIRYRQGKYEGFLSRDDMEHFLVAIFESSPLRDSFIRDLSTTLNLEAEAEEWTNEDW